MTQYAKWGLHLQGGQTDPNPALDTGVSNFVVLNGDIGSLENGLARRLRDGLKVRGRDGIILIRDYEEDMMSHDPNEKPKYVAEYMWKLHEAGITDHITPGNELNLALEHKEGMGSQRYWESAEGYKRMNAWCLAWARKFRELCPWAVIHWPALAAGHGEDTVEGNFETLEKPGYEICKESILACDVLGVHDYPEPYDLQDYLTNGTSDFLWWRLWRFARPVGYKNADDLGGIMNWKWMNKPIFIKECSGFRNFNNLQSPYMLPIEKWEKVIGVGMWIWQTPSEQHKAGELIGHPGERGIINAPKQLFDMPVIIPGADPIDPPNNNEEEPHVPEFRYRFAERAAKQDIGHPLEDMIYHYAETENEMVSQWTDKGLLIYVKRYDKDYFFEDSLPKNP